MAYISIDIELDNTSLNGTEISTGVYVFDGSSSGLSYELNENGSGENETGIEFAIENLSDYTVSFENSFLSDWLYLETDDIEAGENIISLRIHDDYVFPYFYQNGYTNSIEFTFDIELVDQNNDIATIEGANFFLENPRPVISSNDINLSIVGHESLAEIYEHSSAGAFTFSNGDGWEYQMGTNDLSLGIDLDANEDVTWTIEDSSDNGNLFNINSDGQISWNDTPEFEQDYSTSFTVTAEDGEGKTSEVEITNISLVAGEYTDMTLNGSTGNETLEGKSGDDRLYSYAGNDTLIGNDGNDRLYGGYGDDVLNGGSGDDQLFGEADDDILNGGDGDDRLTGGEGADILRGGNGNDIYVLDDELDIIQDGGSSSDKDQIIVRFEVLTYTLPDSITDLTLSSSVFNGVGNPKSNTITGNSSSNEINGLSGNDTLNGGSGEDTLTGGSGIDALYGGSGADTLYGGSGIDTLTGGSGSDDLFGGSSTDNLHGGSGKDTLTGGSGTDTLFGGSGKDTLYGGKSADEMYGGSGKDTLYGGTGADILNGGSRDDTLEGGSGRDTLAGGSGGDTLTGGSGNDSLLGGSGVDTLTGGSGNDSLTGGSGNDIFQINTGSGRDLITDYKSGKDSIKLLNNISESDLTFSYSGGDTRITYNDDLLAIVEDIANANEITFI